MLSLRELPRREHAEGRMRPDIVVVITKLGRSPARLEDRGERVHVEQLF